MFRSKTRDIIIPQSEHAQFAGNIALNWGNDNFDQPDFDFDSFVMGVALHDQGHGFFDVNEIGAMDEQQAYKADSALVANRLHDTIADAVAHFHVLRLLSNHPEYADLIETCEQIIEEDLKKTGISRERFLWADRITMFCDYLSFDFCFDKTAERRFAVGSSRSRDQIVEIKMFYDGNEKIYIDPWPLKADQYRGYILGYEEKGYPETLKPVLKRFHLLKG